MAEGIGKDYSKLAGVLEPMGKKIEALIRELLAAEGLRVLDVTHRVKTDVSATKKINGSSGRYNTYGDLHDMLGVRVITYLASDVDKVVALLRANFDVDEGRSLDKLKGMDPDRFGYLSYHLVLKLNKTRADLTEWAPYRDVYFEVQVRSVLQHAWAEIEHDLGYKSTSGIPAHLKRRFARLAGLLELADSEFDSVSGEVADHVERVEDVIAHGGEVAIDRDSIRALALANGVVRRADEAIAKGIGATLEGRMARGYADARAEELIDVGFKTTDDVIQAVESEFAALVRFATAWFSQPRPEYHDPDDLSSDQDDDGRYVRLSPGISLFYLYLHWEMRDPDAETRMQHSIRYMDDPQQQRAFRAIHDDAFGRADSQS